MIKHKSLLSHVKNGWRNYNIWWLWDWKTKVSPLHKSYYLKDADNGNILVSNKISSGEKNYKYFIGYL